MDLQIAVQKFKKNILIKILYMFLFSNTVNCNCNIYADIWAFIQLNFAERVLLYIYIYKQSIPLTKVLHFQYVQFLNSLYKLIDYQV